MNNIIIRSQDKKRIVSFVGMTMGVVGDSQPYSIFVYNNNNGSVLLGKYSTEEKAMKVMERICNHVDNMFYSTVVPNQCGMLTPPVFEMPGDNEV